MDKKLFFVIGSILVVIALATVWGYLLFFGAPDTPGTFTTLLPGRETEENTPPNTEVTSTSTMATSTVNRSFRPLTTRVVAGHRTVQTSTTSPAIVHFVEAGTGHIYTINLETGVEERRSNTTIPMATEAVFNSDASRVAILSGHGNQSTLHLGAAPATSTTALSFLPLAGEWSEIYFSSPDEVLLAQVTKDGVVGFAKNLRANTTKSLFTVPFREAIILWGETSSSDHFVYPKPARLLEGAIYRIRQGVLERLPLDGFDLTALGHAGTIIFSKQAAETYAGFAFFSGQTRPLPFGLLPEKCVFGTTTFIYCGVDTSDSSNLPEAWYQGKRSFTDTIWEIDTATGEGTQLADPRTELRRPLDLMKPSITPDLRNMVFINKSDKTLWLYEF